MAASKKSACTDRKRADNLSIPFASSIPGLLPDDLPVRPDQNAIRLLGEYVDMLYAWNRAINLVGARSKKDIFTDLICDSLYLAHFLQTLPAMPLSDKDIILDPGAGAGLPGVPLRMLWQQGRYIMIEIRSKRAIFLANVLARLKLPRTEVVNGDFETFAKKTAAGQTVGAASLVISRAFRPWPEMLTLCRDRLTDTGMLIILANSQPPEDFDGWKLAGSYSYKSGSSRRWFWALKPLTRAAGY